MTLSPRIAAGALAVALALAIVATAGDELMMGVRWALVCTAILLVATAGAALAPYADHPSHRSPATTPTTAAASGVMAAAAPRPVGELLADLPPMRATPRLVDVDTGELAGDRLLRAEERIAELDQALERGLERLGRVLADQAELTSSTLAQIINRLPVGTNTQENTQ